MNQTPEQRAAAARALMVEITMKFIERTRAELETLRARLPALGAGDSAALAEIRNLAHRICGTGATLGFDALADLAHALEKIADAQPPDQRPDAAAMQQLARGIDALVAEVARAEPRGG